MSRLHIVFDLDDTLYPERQFAISGFRACERWLEQRYGVNGIVDDMTRMLDDGHMRSLFEITLRKHLGPYDDSLLESFIDIYRLHPPEISLYDDAAPALDHFEALGPIGLITDGQEEVQSSKVRALELEPRFAHIIYTHALGGRSFSKPNPRAFELMEQALGGPGDRFLYVGDNPSKDFVAPNKRGWISVQIHRDQRIHHRAQTAEGGAPQHEITALTELPAILEKLA
ncbi:MAG: HAD family hydrolase [Hyphomicrobiaceae bacterium]